MTSPKPQHYSHEKAVQHSVDCTEFVDVPEEPTIKIRSSRGWKLIDFHEVWIHRELLYFFVWRDLKVRYRQTFLGVSWVILQPLLMMLVFAFFLGFIVRGSQNPIPYPLFLYTALLSWTFFSNAVSSSSHSLTTNAQMITKTYFPRVIIPLAAIIVRLVDFFVASVVLIALFVYYGIYPEWGLLILPLLVVHLTLLALGIGLWFSALNVKYRDVGTVLPVLLQIWLFVSPIVYPLSFVPARSRPIYDLNPFVGIVENIRASLFGLPFQYGSFIISIVITLALLVYSTHFFRKMEDEFADTV